jgi:Uma2 family endonuclease
MPAGTMRRPQMAVEDFEEIASHAPETVRMEFIDGRIEVKPVPDSNHVALITWLARQCMQSRPDLDLHVEQGLRIEEYRNGRARVDGVLAPVRHFLGQGEWADPDGALMTVEVTSYDRDTDKRDRCEKPEGYAAAGIPVYLLIDRDASTVTVHSGPEHGRYRDIHTVSFGEEITLPSPVDITLETESLKHFVR